MALEPGTPTTRRGLLAAAVGGLAALAGASFGRGGAALAANGDTVKVGNSYDSTAETKIKNSNTGAGQYAIVGRGASASGAGLYGLNTATTTGADTADGVLGRSDLGAGVHGKTADGFAILAEVTGPGTAIAAFNSGSNATINSTNTAGPGIEGHSNGGPAVYGLSAASDPGVHGQSESGIGVFGRTSGASIPDVRAGIVGSSDSHTGGYFISDTGTALNVQGKAKFSRGGRITVGAHISAKLVQVFGMTSSSYVLAMIQTDEPGVWIRAIVPGTDEFTVHFNTGTTKSTVVGYLVLN